MKKREVKFISSYLIYHPLYKIQTDEGDTVRA